MSFSITSTFAALDAPRQPPPSPPLPGATRAAPSSGRRLDGSVDDAADPTIAERLHTPLRGTNAALRNTNEAIGLTQTALGGLAKLSEDLQRMRELATQARADAQADKKALDERFAELAAGARNVIDSTTFDGKAIIGADAASTRLPAASANEEVEDESDEDEATGGVPADLASADVMTRLLGSERNGSERARIDSNADAAVDRIDKAIGLVDGERAALGALQNRLAAKVSGPRIAAHDPSAPRGRVLDEAAAADTSALSRARILQQPHAALATQAHLTPRSVLSLLDATSPFAG